MSYLLHIETATPVCSVALSNDNQLIAKQESTSTNVHSERLTCFIEEVLKSEHIACSQLSAVAVSEGPGSYTGLRIGVSAAKGLCYALEIPLIAIKTLESMSLGMKKLYRSETAFYAPMLDARRMEVYSALYDFQGNEKEATNAKIVDETAFSTLLSSQTIVFGGTGAEKCRSVIEGPNAIFLPDFQASAEWMIPLAYQKFVARDFVDTAYFEPFYLKNFEAAKPHVKGLQ
ncbi:MAG: tRNA (adenosine(37)-N6)-threonylcarbamoyltransferase complex dimerization subunit type 1 TsaB [Bacteroidales bacterium]|nr:tRNA (adenosine(37)-N6)-threonylcarbamoyltransferase complex dimerization subunit type 1 TsaB [Bacteroidales bacterium]